MDNENNNPTITEQGDEIIFALDRFNEGRSDEEKSKFDKTHGGLYFLDKHGFLLLLKELGAASGYTCDIDDIPVKVLYDSFISTEIFGNDYRDGEDERFLIVNGTNVYNGEKCKVFSEADANMLEGTDVKIPEGYTDIWEDAFRKRSDITSLLIPGSVRRIWERAFYDCENLEALVISDGVRVIKRKALPGFGNLKSINIPKSVTLFEQKNLDWYGLGFEGFIVDDENEYYSSEDGVLFNKDKTTLIKYAQGKKAKEYTIPNSVTTIENGAFFECRNLTIKINRDKDETK